MVKVDNNWLVHMNVEKQYMSEKRYNPLALGYIHVNGIWDNELKSKRINKTEFRQGLREKFKIGPKQIKLIIDTFCDLGFLKEDGKEFVLQNVDGIYITLQADTIRWFINNSSPRNFKVYCYLKNQYEKHVRYEYRENYFFSHTEIAKVLGYTKDVRNIRFVKESLISLEQEGLIEYNSELVGRPGSHGLYMELYKVNDFSKSQIKAAKQTKKQLPQLVESKEFIVTNIDMPLLTKSNINDIIESVNNNISNEKLNSILDEVDLLDMNDRKAIWLKLIDKKCNNWNILRRLEKLDSSIDVIEIMSKDRPIEEIIKIIERL